MSIVDINTQTEFRAIVVLSHINFYYLVQVASVLADKWYI